MQKITPCLWFDNNAEEAMNFYLSVFKDSKKGNISYNGDNAMGKKGDVLVCTFFLNGQEFMALNGGPLFQFSEAVSMAINCKDQTEIDYYWEKLIAGGGEESQCGWLKDKFGFSWQVVPDKLGEMLSGDQAKADRVMGVVMKMRKLDLKQMEDAAAGK